MQDRAPPARGGLAACVSWEVTVEFVSLPTCLRCKLGVLVPLSDFGGQGASIHYKAWACINPDCGFNIKIRNGDLYIDEPICSGSDHAPRVRKIVQRESR
jgi:hypothetical protein